MFSVKPYKKSNIYETDRQTSQVGIYAKCTVCGKVWGSGNYLHKYFIPNDGSKFKIEYIQRDSKGDISISPEYIGFKSFEEAGFIYSDYITQKGEYTFSIG